MKAIFVVKLEEAIVKVFEISKSRHLKHHQNGHYFTDCYTTRGATITFGRT